jgi:hypothetical protein
MGRRGVNITARARVTGLVLVVLVAAFVVGVPGQASAGTDAWTYDFPQVWAFTQGTSLPAAFTLPAQYDWDGAAAALQTRVVNQGTKTLLVNPLRNYAAGLALKLTPFSRYASGAGTAFTLRSLYNDASAIYRVGAGKADPTALMNIVPHAVYAWEATRGPMNLPTQTFTRDLHTTWYDGSRIDLTISTRVDFSSTKMAPFSTWGYDPQTDSISRTTSFSLTQRSFTGTSFATLPRVYSLPSMSTFSPSTLALARTYTATTMSTYHMPSISSYTPPRIQTYTPITIPRTYTYTPLPTISPIQRYTPPPISTYMSHSYTMPSIGSNW